MLSVGEETGSLEGMLHDVAEFYEGDLDLRLTQLTTSINRFCCSSWEFWSEESSS